MQDTKYHVGDVVIVRQDLDPKKYYWMRSGVKDDAPWRNVVSDVVTEDMRELCGTDYRNRRNSRYGRW